jgi:hypothetical protein
VSGRCLWAGKVVKIRACRLSGVCAAAGERPIIAGGFQMDELPLSSSNLSATAITAIASASLLAFAGGFATAWLLEQYLKSFIPQNLAPSDECWEIDILP